jgi:hypothetical protein
MFIDFFELLSHFFTDYSIILWVAAFLSLEEYWFLMKL